jgi:hypothetical protein
MSDGPVFGIEGAAADPDPDAAGVLGCGAGVADFWFVAGGWDGVALAEGDGDLDDDADGDADGEFEAVPGVFTDPDTATVGVFTVSLLRFFNR